MWGHGQVGADALATRIAPNESCAQRRILPGPAGPSQVRLVVEPARGRMRATRQLVIGALRLAGRTDNAAGLRHHAGDPAYLLTTPGIT